MDLNDVRPRMDKSLEVLKGEISSIRTGRANSAIVENIVCSVYGGAQRLRVVELGTIAVSDARSIMVTPWDNSIIGEIRQGILAANVGLTPIIDGAVIRIQIPSLTQERREEYLKLLSRMLEGGKIAIRQIRHDKMNDIKKSFEEDSLSEDEKFRLEQDLQKLTDEFVDKIDETGKKKEEDLMTL